MDPRQNAILLWIGLTIGIMLALTYCVKNTFGYTIKFNAAESHLLNTAYKEGKVLIKKPEILQAILLNETVAGRYGRLGDTRFKDWKMRSYGVMQIQYATAYDLLSKKFPKYFNKNMTKNEEATFLSWLTIDDRFNIHIAGLIVKDLWERYKNWDYVMLAYNVGIGNIRKYGLKYDPNSYLAKANFYLEHSIPTFNKPIYRAEMLRKMTKRDISRMLSLIPKVEVYQAPLIYHHIVVKGDTFSKLAQTYFGDWRQWRKIQKLNPNVEPTKIVIGSVLQIFPY